MRTSAALDCSFSARPASVAAARRVVREWLRVSMTVSDMVVADVALAVSEACTNVVVHAYPEGHNGDATFHVRARCEDGGVHISVTDHGRGLVPRPDSPGAGLGLPVIASVTESVDMGSTEDGTGTVVAMRFLAA